MQQYCKLLFDQCYFSSINVASSQSTPILNCLFFPSSFILLSIGISHRSYIECGVSSVAAYAIHLFSRLTHGLLLFYTPNHLPKSPLTKTDVIVDIDDLQQL
mgnify:CR=1 FL=1